MENTKNGKGHLLPVEETNSPLNFGKQSPPSPSPLFASVSRVSSFANVSNWMDNTQMVPGRSASRRKIL